MNKDVAFIAGIIIASAAAFALGYVMGKYLKIPPKRKRYKIITDEEGNIKEIIVTG